MGVRRPISVLGAVGAMMFLAVSSALATSYDIILTTAGAQATANGALFIQGGIGAGTGNFDPFLTIGSNADTESGINSCVASQSVTDCKNKTFDTFYGGSRTHAIQVAAIPVTTVSGVKYREFSLDANDQGSDDYMSIDELKIFIDDQSTLNAYTDGTETFLNDTGTAATKVYDMTPHGVLMRSQSLTPGSGVSDITVLVPNSAFPAQCYYGSLTCNKWLYFWSAMGGAQTIDGHNYNVTAGFEEWRVRLAPVVNVSKTVHTSYTNTYSWTLNKSVTPTSAAIFNGDTQDAQWTVSWTRSDPVQSAITVSGVITVTNPTGGNVISSSIPATVNSVSDLLTNAGAATVSGCAVSGKPITFPYTLAAQASITCNYSKTVSTTADDTNTASAVIVDANQPGGTATYDTGLVPVSFSGATVTNVHATATITDLQGPLNMTGVNASGTTSYTNTYTTCGTKSNTATLTPSDAGTPLTASASTVITCYDLSVTKTATPTWVRTFTWTIDKTVNPASSEIFENDQQNIDYSITATKSLASDAFGVSGTITIANNNPSKSAVITALSDVADGVAGTINSSDCTFPLTIAASSSKDCGYTVTGLPDAVGTNTATATNRNRHWDTTGASLGNIGTTDYSGSQAYSLSAPSGTVADSASVNDTETVDAGLAVTCSGDCTWPQVISSTTTFNYTDTASSATAGSYDINNTATVTFTGGSDSASQTSTVVVRALTVTKTAVPTWVRTYDWTVSKSVDPTTIEIDPGNSGVLHYTITATRTVASDAYGVSGAITITNNNTSKAAIVTALGDVADGVTATITDCSFPLTIAAGGSQVCHYTASGLPDADGTNNATATNQNRHWSTAGTSLGNLGTTDYSGSASYLLTSPSSQVDATATVNDPGITCPTGFTCTPDYGGNNPPWTFTDTGTVTFDVTITAGAGVPCDTFFPVPNVVHLVEVDSGQTHDASALSTIWTGPCPSKGCTPGFWQGGVGITLWDQFHDPQWQSYGGASAWNPFVTTDTFTSFFLPTGDSSVDSLKMIDIVGSGGTSNWALKAARDLIAAYLNASFLGTDYPYGTATILSDWSTAVAGGTTGFQTFHAKYSAANQLGCPIGTSLTSATYGSGPAIGVMAALVPAMGVLFGLIAWFRPRRRSDVT